MHGLGVKRKVKQGNNLGSRALGVLFARFKKNPLLWADELSIDSTESKAGQRKKGKGEGQQEIKIKREVKQAF